MVPNRINKTGCIDSVKSDAALILQIRVYLAEAGSGTSAGTLSEYVSTIAS